MPVIGFAQPLILLALIALPLLWWLLRATPPAPIRRRFPAVALLLGLRDDQVQADRTPWWLMALRMLAVAAVIVGFAGPVLNPRAPSGEDGPLLVVVDATWADAPGWTNRLAELRQVVEGAGRAGRPVALVPATDPPGAAPFQTADALLPRLSGLIPRAWGPDYAGWATALPEGPFATLWISDGLDHPGRAEFLSALEDRGPVRVMEAPDATLALRPARREGEALIVPAARRPVLTGAEAVVLALGPDPSGAETVLARTPLRFDADATEAAARFTLPPELRNRVTRFQIEGVRSAGAVTLAGDALRRREVALIPTGPQDEGADVLAPLFYIRQALAPHADLIEVPLDQALPANPDVIVLTDAAPADVTALEGWVRAGGTLLRFAGPRMAAAPDDPLLPVPLRVGGREMGGALSWDAPRRLAPFPESSPFHGLPVPEEVTVTRQVLADPGPDLATRTLAALEDGTPFVTRRTLGQGQVILFHATANADWSNLPLSGLFVGMLTRLTQGAGTGTPEDLAGRIWTPDQALDAFGRLTPAPALSGVAGEALATAPPSATMPPGIYADGDARAALNTLRADTPLEAAVWPDGQVVEGLTDTPERSLKGALLTVALLALMVDAIAALAVSGRLARVAWVAALLLLPVAESRADPVADTQVLRLAHVLTGDARVDDLAQQGLLGLSRRLSERTTVEPGAPVGVDPDRDDLAFFPLLYWPVTADAPTPSPAALARLNDFLRTGGMILFDTRDGDLPSTTTPEAQALQRIAAGLDIPPLEQVPEDHVLTRTFYLLQDFPGRYTNRALWVEAAPDPGAVEEGQPFRHLNDGVTPVVIGGNDWAAAWAVDETGFPALPVGRGFAGERQREIAVRFGINLVIHVLTGNYKNDQIHVPALLERLGN
ncbi:DUF4159 domain-containing protein [Falsirhodobacter halotolerans]|uniref:DUF4159 domain-containing protein n=1 Tax=Falsirhodobacter halotolerans TaxID=1146892 RepID=UPI001FD297CC|nr:DUF4159 domain-containing protein [Falsirhodobacter halotolerans]MCJ8138800.1 DUF4159 domain-containing protein [Falsirhodobacter halotolerans]